MPGTETPPDQTPPDPQAMIQAGIALTLVRMGFVIRGSPSLAAVGTAVTSLPGLGTIPLPVADASSPTAAYLLQVENHPLQDGVEGLPAALPSGCCRGGESSTNISPSAELGASIAPPILLQPALPRHTSPRPGDRRHARTVPAHLSPCQPRGWQMVLLAGGPAAASRGQHRCAPRLTARTWLQRCRPARGRGRGGAARQVMLALEGGCI